MGATPRIHGSLVAAILEAGRSLELLFGSELQPGAELDVGRWYPMALMEGFVQKVQRYDEPGPVLEQVGIEMMKGWYHLGAGKEVVASALDFLRYQTGSHGFASVVEGPEERTGRFELLELEPSSGRAVVASTTIFPRDLERGVLLGGLGLAGDLLYFDVSNALDADRFDIAFVTGENGSSLAWYDGEPLSGDAWELRHHKRQAARKERYWHSINQTLNLAYAQMQEALSQAKVLSGLLPICASCKRIRDDQGYWNQLEHFISEHSEAQFSHGICPECAQELYPRPDRPR